MARVLFLQDSGINESLALTELSGWLKARGHETYLLLSEEEKDLGQAISGWRPQLAVVPCHVAAHTVALGLAEQVKQAVSDCTVVLAGTHATFEPELVRHGCVDAVCVGEAEHAIAEMGTCIDAGESFDEVPNLCLCREGKLVTNPVAPLLQDLNELPLPDRNLYYRYEFLSRLSWKKFSTGRGCIHNCAFCWNPRVRDMYTDSGPFTRRKSPERAVEEVQEVLKDHPIKTVHFSDDLFTVQPSWLETFAPLYREKVGIPFTCNSSVELVSPRSMDAIAAAGCHGVAIGIETGNERLRTRILKKTVTNDDIRKAAACIKTRGMELITFNMLASPGETLEDAFSTIALNREIGTDHIRLSLAVPIPFTEWENEAQEEGLLPEDYGERRVEGLSHPDVAFESPDAQSFRNLYYLFRPAVHYPALEPLIRQLVRLPTARPLDFLRLMVAYEEKKITRLGWLEGLRFYSHVGDPRRRTANYVALL